ncbi:MAG: MAPEG family protein [Oceanicaulis sp.]|nr:MAPEG family protein [Oceanicaulis sp.]
MYQSILTPVLILVAWTLVMWLWMYATRLPAMRAAGIDPAKLTEKSQMDVLPRKVRQVADNHNHLHEQPVLFYALAIYIHLTGAGGDTLLIGLAWGYVTLRVIHSLFQATVNFIPVRFAIYALATIVLIIMTVNSLMALA